MSQFSQSNRAQLAYAREGNTLSAYGVVPSAASLTMQVLRYTGETLDLDKKTARSEVIRADRMNDDLTYLGRSIAGDISGELSSGDWDEFMAAALGRAAYTSIDIHSLTNSDLPTVTVTTAVVNGVNTATLGITTSGALPNSDFGAAGVIPGILVYFSGFTNATNNGWKYVLSVDTVNKHITVLNKNGMVAEAGAHVQYCASFIVNGSDTPSYVIEKGFLDNGIYASYSGCYFNTMSLDMTAMDRIKITFGLMGKENTVTAASVASTLVQPGTLPSITASVNIGSLIIQGVPVVSAVKSFKVDTSNNLRTQEVIASATPANFGFGSFESKGSTETYLQDPSLWQQVLAHTDTSQAIITQDIDGFGYSFVVPRANYTKGSGKASGINQDVMLPLEWEASRDSVSNSQMIISRTYNPATKGFFVPGYTM